VAVESGCVAADGDNVARKSSNDGTMFEWTCDNSAWICAIVPISDAGAFSFKLVLGDSAGACDCGAAPPPISAMVLRGLTPYADSNAESSFMMAPAWMSLNDAGGRAVCSAADARSIPSVVSGEREKWSLHGRIDK